MSRDHIRRHPLSAYQRAYELIGLNDRCVEEPTDDSDLWALTQPHDVIGGYGPLHKSWYDQGLESKITQAQAMEHMIHFLLNDEPLESKRYTQDQYCQNFLPSSQCPGSPCLL